MILSLETSTTVCSSAISNKGQVLAFAEVHIEQSHASKLAALIDDVISLAGISKKELQAVAISCGPGSYTGLRIGVSTAKGFCVALGIPLISINTLELMASQLTKFVEDHTLLCPMIDARRMEVYCLLKEANHSLLQPTHAKVVDENSFEEFLKDRKIFFFGNGSDKCSSVILNNNAIFIKGIYPSAASMGAIAFTKYEDHIFEDLINFEPLYLKEFQIKKTNGRVE